MSRRAVEYWGEYDFEHDADDEAIDVDICFSFCTAFATNALVHSEEMLSTNQLTALNHRLSVAWKRYEYRKR